MSKSRHKKKFTALDVPKGYRPTVRRTVNLKKDFLWLDRLITKLIIVYVWSFSEEVWRADQVIGVTMEDTKHGDHKHGKRIPMSSFRERDGRDVKLNQSLTLHEGATDSTNTSGIRTEFDPAQKITPTTESGAGVGDTVRSIIEKYRGLCGDPAEAELKKVELPCYSGQSGLITDKKHAHAIALGYALRAAGHR